MTVNSHSVGPDGRHGVIATNSMSKIAHGFLLISTRFGAKVKSTLKAVQTARMLSALSSMSDYQLAQIGIQRPDIPNYAKTLMADE